MICKTIPVIANPICRGKDIFISFLTPDSEVYVEEPVKFIAIKDEIAVIMKNHEILIKPLSPVKFSRRSII